MAFYRVLFTVPLLYARHLIIMNYFNHPKKDSAEWIISEIDRLLEADKDERIRSATTTTTTTTTIATTIKTTNIFGGDDGGTPTAADAVATTTAAAIPPPPPPIIATTVEQERKLARIWTPLWFKQTQENIVVLNKSLKKVESLKAEVKLREGIIKRLADLTQEELENELKEEAFYERYP